MSDNNSDSHRREFLRLGVAGSIVGIAGCSGLSGSEIDEGSEGDGSENPGGENKEKIISNLNISNPSTGTLQISSDSEVTLDTLTVEVSGPNTTTFTEDDFGYTVGEKYRYKTTYEVESAGEYTATVVEVVDRGGDEGVANEKASITIGEDDVPEPPEPIQIGPKEEPDPSQHQVPSPPEADWVVASDGSGDYETMEEVLKITKGGDVIKLKSGEYTLSGTGFGALVGSGQDETTIRVDTNDIESGFSIFNATVSGGSTVINSLVKFYNCNVNLGIRSYANVTPSAMIDAVGSKFNNSIEASSLDAKGCEFSDIRFRQGGSLDKKSVCKLTDSIFNGGFNAESASGNITRCEFIETAKLAGLKSTDTVFSSGAEGGKRFENCLFEAGVEDTVQPVAIDSGARLLKHSIVRGRITGKIPNLGGARINNIVGNIFDPESDDVVVVHDGSGNNYGCQLAKNLEYNAFIGCKLKIVDINRFEGGVERMSADHNYYHSFDGSDENDDGIIDKPYPLPGSADVVDRNPLASRDIKKYLEQKRDTSQ